MPTLAEYQNTNLIRAVKEGVLRQGFCLDALLLARLENPDHFYLSAKIESEMFFAKVLPLVRKRAALQVSPERRHRFFRYTRLVDELKSKVITTSDIEIESATCETNSFRLTMPAKFDIDDIRNTLTVVCPLLDHRQWLMPREMLEIEDLWANALNMFIGDFERSVRYQLELALNPNC